MSKRTRPPRAHAPTSPTPAAQAQLAALGRQVQQLIGSGDFRAALVAARAALIMVPDNGRVLGDIALCHMRLGELKRAQATYLQALRAQPDDENLVDGLAECCGRLGQIDAAATHGRHALQLKAAQIAQQPAWPIPAARAPVFASTAPARNLLSFSLFGGHARYCDTAILNVERAHQLLPAWRCRFYLDGSVPPTIIGRLRTAGADIVHMDLHAARAAHALMGRFLVLDDAGVERFLLRDADSLVSVREAAAVNAWIDSGAWFHLMRDFYTPTELLLAGMWGGCGGVFRDVARSVIEYTNAPPRLGARVIDQHWLRARAWPTVRQSVLAHDGVFGFAGAVPFPAHAPVTDQGEDFHVGANVGQVNVGGETGLADGSLVHWCVLDADGREICRYAGACSGGKWSASLPRAYADDLLAGRWCCEVVT